MEGERERECEIIEASLLYMLALRQPFGSAATLKVQMLISTLLERILLYFVYSIRAQNLII